MAMNQYICIRCNGNCDPGELRGGVCDSCRNQEARETENAMHMRNLIMSPFGQINLLDNDVTDFGTPHRNLYQIKAQNEKSMDYESV